MKGVYHQATAMLRRFNVRNLVDHHYNEYLSKSFIASVVITVFVYLKYSSHSTASHLMFALQNYAVFLFSIVGLLLVVSLIAFLLFVRYVDTEILKRDRGLANAFLFPFIVNIQLLVVVTLLLLIGLFGGVGVTNTDFFFVTFTYFFVVSVLYTLEIVGYAAKIDSLHE